MKITAISPQVKNQNRVNISVDGKYRFSLDIYQLVDLGIKVGQYYEESQIIGFEQESDFGKVYGRALEYSLIRPRSVKEISEYLYKKTRSKIGKEGKKIAGVSPDITLRVKNRLIDKGYIDDQKFTKYWVENRFLTKGISKRKMIMELRSKGINSTIIDNLMSEIGRSDNDEIQKIIAKKRRQYPDDQKLMMYLARQGFNYDDIKNALKAQD